MRKAKSLVRRQFQEKVLPNEESLSNWLAFFDSEFSLWQARTPEGSQNMQGLYYGYLSALKKHAPNKPEPEKPVPDSFRDCGLASHVHID